MKEWVLPTIGTFICWGLWSFIPKITTKYIDPKSAVIYEVVGGIFLSLVVLYFLCLFAAISESSGYQNDSQDGKNNTHSLFDSDGFV